MGSCNYFVSASDTAASIDLEVILMNANHHIIAGAAGAGAYLYGGTTATTETIILCVSMAVVGSLLPDIDHPQSLINRVLIVTRLLTLFVTHRGITHTLWALCFVAWMGFSFLPEAAAIGLVIGYASHLALDLITPQGIRPLYPAKLRVRI